MAMKYLALARKYRPKCFADLIGQDVLTKVLHYSIQNNKLASSFLFTGIRGIGKTTSARIVAQTINCTNLQEQSALVAACGQCENCLACANQSHPDIVEIDAASYTSVDNVRDVIEKSMYRPVLGKYKVFIIDEVHMLSKSAFNALLKTLEEPPAHVIFMLLTTEINKVPLTILSRCQKFNLKRFGINDLVMLLENICKAEQIAYDSLALQAIAHRADGSARDATTLLEQVSFLASQRQQKIDLSIVEEGLDLNHARHALKLLQYILAQDSRGAIDLIASLYEENFDFTNIIVSIIELIALLSKIKLIPGYTLGEFISYEAEVKELLFSIDLGFLTSLWQIFDKGLPDVAKSSNQLIAFEMLIIKSIYCAILPSPEQISMQTNMVAQNATPALDSLRNLPSSASSPKPKAVEPIKLKAAEPIKPKISELAGLEKNIALSVEPNATAEPEQQSAVHMDLVNIANVPDLEGVELFEFIKYIHHEHLFSLYHFVMNECGIVHFKNNIVKLETSNMRDDIKVQLAQALQNWSNHEWQLSHSINSSFKSLHNDLKAKALLGDNIKKVFALFPEAQISDVWFNFLAKR